MTLRRCRFELTQAEARAHIVAGYLKALDVIDEIIAIIRGSADTEIDVDAVASGGIVVTLPQAFENRIAI